MTKVKQQRGLDVMQPYTPGKPIEEVKREYGIEDVIKLASNENPLGVSPKALAAMSDALAGVNMYPDGQSYYLRRAVAKYHGIDMEQVAMGNGADGIIMQVCMGYLDEESEVIVSQSSFPVYDIYTHVMRAKLVKIPMKEYKLDLPAMAEAITPRTKIIFLCNPNNPTGTIVGAAEVANFMDKVPDHALVIFDEAYYEFVDAEDYPDSFQYLDRGNVMIMRTFSKGHGLAGIRLGYAISNSEILAPLNRVKEPFAVNLLAQAAGIGAIQDDEFLQKTVAMNRAGRRFLYKEFERLGLRYLESHTNFILVEIGARAVEIQKEMLKKGVIVRPCVNYDLPNFLRITIGDATQNARLVDTLEELL